MTFINEYIPEEDLEKYNFAELNRRSKKAGIGPGRDWTIDRDADIWLRQFYVESNHTELDGGFTGVSGWNFYWKGSLMFVELQDIASGRVNGNHKWSRKKLLDITIPSELEGQRKKILDDLESIFIAHKGAGVFAKCSEYSFTLEL